jgi:hypothetical protein
MQIFQLHVVDTSDYNVMLSIFVVTEDYNRDARGSDRSVHITQRLEATRGVIRFPLGLAPMKLDDDGFMRRFDKFAKDLSAFLAECEP